jgi:glycosyltransferase involved in cell wall biosynthesis
MVSLVNILITTPTYLPSLDGVSIAVATQARLLANLGHEITIFSQLTSASEWERVGPEVSLCRFDLAGCAHPWVPLRGDIITYRKCVLSGSFDVIIVHAWACSTTDALLEVWPELATRIIFCSHGSVITSFKLLWKSPHMWFGWLKYSRTVVPFVLRRSAAPVFLAELDDRERFWDVALAKQLCSERLNFIPNCIDLNVMDRIPRDFDFGLDSSSTCVILCVGRFTEEKNQRSLLRAVLQLRSVGISVVFVGPEHNDYADRLLREWQASLNKSGECKIFSALSRRDTLRAIKTADILVSTSKTECQPIVILEAMAFGVPFLSTNVGCVDALKGGLVAASFSDLVDGLAKLVSDRALRHDLGSAGRSHIESTFATAVVEAQVSALVERVSADNQRVQSRNP